jgi:hypothetical protein
VESIISMCPDVTSFTKDNMNARKDLVTLCDHPYFLKPIEKKEVLRWLKTLEFPNRYAVNIK